MTPPDDAPGGVSGSGEDTDGDDEAWRFSVEDVSEEEADEQEGSVFGPAPPDEVLAVDRGDPGLENAAFVVLGVAVSIGLLAAVIGLI